MIPDTLYAAAFAFRQTKLCQQLYDSQLFALKHPDGSIPAEALPVVSARPRLRSA